MVLLLIEEEGLVHSLIKSLTKGNQPETVQKVEGYVVLY